MVNHNSLSFYKDLVICMYRDIASDYGVVTRVQKVEIRVIENRFLQEGISFLTKTLPSYGKALDSTLATGAAFCAPGFETPVGSVIPKFLGWLLTQILEHDGIERLDASPVALKHFRQLVYLVYKLKIPYREEDCKTVLDSFVEVDAGLADFREACFSELNIIRARQYIAGIFGHVDPRAIQPRHGPGSVATGEDTIHKARLCRIYSSMEIIFPFTEFMMFNLSHVCDAVEDIKNLEVIPEPTAKVVLVPKDSRGPRLISAEPLEVQWIQQGLGKVMETAINCHPFTGGFVNFTDQTVNQRLALEGSRTSEWVTLDMKEASDRVSKDLVISLFAHVPDLLAAMLACRSTGTVLPDGREIRLNKFAPMGSRLCFPVEAICFYVLIASALCMEKGYSRRKIRGRLFIFGDDIIMRREDYPVALQCLPKFGLMFNPRKCCTHGSFRESCGVDAYKGVNVTPTRVSTVWCHNRKTPEVISSYVSLRNALYGRGYFLSAAYVKRKVESVYGQIPWTDHYEKSLNGAFCSQASGPAWVTDTVPVADLNVGFRRRFSPTHQRQVFSWVSKPLKALALEDSWQGLLRRYSDGFGASGGVYALSRRNCLKRGWMTV
jgi:hypothetical protein